MGPSAAVPSVEASEEASLLSSEASLEVSEEASLEAEEVEAEALLSEELLSVLPQAASIETHSAAAIKMEIAFFIT